MHVSHSSFKWWFNVVGWLEVLGLLELVETARTSWEPGELEGHIKRVSILWASRETQSNRRYTNELNELRWQPEENARTRKEHAGNG